MALFVIERLPVDRFDKSLSSLQGTFMTFTNRTIFDVNGVILLFFVCQLCATEKNANLPIKAIQREKN